jgi:predicted RNA-binding protein with PUA-like domain
MPGYWLVKSEPTEFSFEDLRRSPGSTAEWDGVRNYQARNHLIKMRTGDRVLFYHSSTKPQAVVGTATVVKEAYPDPTQWDQKNKHYDPASLRQRPRWFMVDIRAGQPLPRPVTLEAIKATPSLKSMVLVKAGRLSVQPVTPQEWTIIVRMGGGKP